MYNTVHVNAKKNWQKHLTRYQKGSCNDRCMGDFFPGASRNDLKPESKARPNFFLFFFLAFSPAKPSKIAF